MEDLRYLWTPTSTLRLRDTSGVKSQEQRCIKCGAAFTPKADPDSALCETCAELGSVKNNDTRPDVTDLARCKDPDGMVRCLLCAKLYPAALGQPRSDQICSDCRNSMQGSAKLVCAKCNITICRLAPKVLESGFIIRPNQVFHSNCCNICNPGLTESSVIEIELWQKTQRPKKTISTKSKPAESTKH